MPQYNSTDKRTQIIGIAGYTESDTVLEVIGNTNVTGTSTATAFIGNFSVTETSSNTSFNPIFVSTSTSGNKTLFVDGGISYNPSTNVLEVFNLNVNTSLRLVDDVELYFGTSNDAWFNYNGTGNYLELQLEAAATDFRITDNGTERFRFNKGGQIGLSGANYGSSGQVLTSNGAGSAAIWQNATGAAAGTYGDASNVSQIVVDANGRITSISEVAISVSGGGVTVQDEGVALSTIATTLNFVGAGVVATGTGATKTITISGEGVASINAVDESADTTCFPLFATTATGAVEVKTDASGLIYDSANERLQSTDVAVKGAVRVENSASTERFEILYNETTDSLDFSYFAS